MKSLYVSGSDYSAYEFAQKYNDISGKKLKKKYDEAVKAGGSLVEDDWEIEAKEFEGKVDMEFIDFLLTNIIDNDLWRNGSAFYIVENK